MELAERVTLPTGWSRNQPTLALSHRAVLEKVVVVALRAARGDLTRWKRSFSFTSKNVAKDETILGEFVLVQWGIR
jgi:hypothetical protein